MSGFGMYGPPPQGGGNPDKIAYMAYAQKYGAAAASSADINTIRNYARQVFGGDPGQVQMPQNFMQAGFQQFRNNSMQLPPPPMMGEQPSQMPPPRLQGAYSAGITENNYSTTQNTVYFENTAVNKNLTSYNEVGSEAKKIYDSKEDYQTTRQERKDIKKQTKQFIKDIDSYQREYIDEHESDYKSLKGSAKKAAKAQVMADAQAYAISKFQQTNPGIDIITVFYNDREYMTGGGLFTHKNYKPY